MYVVGISAYYHDSSACLFKNGELIFACEEEKFTGIKHDSSFPVKTLEYIFKTYNLNGTDWNGNCEKSFTNEPPAINSIDINPSVLPLENTIVPVTFNVSVSDSDGYTDITSVFP